MAKTVWLVRHGEALHNVLQRTRGLHESRKPLDPPLTGAGEAQARALGADALAAAALAGGVDLLLVSPLRRTLQTAWLGFGEWCAATATPIVAAPDLQEIGAFPCDSGVARSIIERDFAGVSFEGVPEDWWAVEKTDATARERSAAFTHWLIQRPEERVVVVCHHGTLCQLLSHKFANCEVAQYGLSEEGGWELQSPDPAAQMVQLFDDQRKPLSSHGSPPLRASLRCAELSKASQAVHGKFWHAAVHVWVTTARHDCLLLRRCVDQGLGTSANGAVLAAESAVEAARRLLLEQCGLRVDGECFEPLHEFRDRSAYQHAAVFLVTLADAAAAAGCGGGCEWSALQSYEDAVVSGEDGYAFAPSAPPDGPIFAALRQRQAGQGLLAASFALDCCPDPGAPSNGTESVFGVSMTNVRAEADALIADAAEKAQKGEEREATSSFRATAQNATEQEESRQLRLILAQYERKPAAAEAGGGGGRFEASVEAAAAAAQKAWPQQGRALVQHLAAVARSAGAGEVERLRLECVVASGGPWCAVSGARFLTSDKAHRLGTAHCAVRREAAAGAEGQRAAAAAATGPPGFWGLRGVD